MLSRRACFLWTSPLVILIPRMKKILLSILICIASSSCGDKGTSILDNFSNVVILKDEICVTDSCVAPQNLVLKDYSLFYKEKSQSKLLRRLDLITGEIQEFLSKGNGPGEVTNVIRLAVSDSILQVYTDPEAVLYYCPADLDKNLVYPSKEVKMPLGQSAFASAFQVNGKLFYSGKITLTDTCRYCVYDIDKDSLYSFEGFPKIDSNIQDFPSNDMSKQLAYQGDFVFSPNRDRLFFFFFYGLGFEIIDTRNWKVLYHKMYQYPDVKLKHIDQLNINKVERNPDSLCGFIDACATDNHIFVLYTNKTFKEDYSSGRHILQFDWEGKPITHYISENDLNSISIDDSEKNIYATTNEENARIIKYKIR